MLPCLLRLVRPPLTGLALALLALMPSLARAQTSLAITSAEAAQLQRHLSGWYETAVRKAPGSWGVAVADQTGKILWSVNPNDLLVPASTVKLFTTGFARSVLGGNARRPTRVLGSGHVEPTTGEWTGNWALELNGDPSFERGVGEGPTLYDLALQLASTGIRRMTGPLDVRSTDGPASAIFPAVWSSRHRGRLFAPLIGPLTLHENVVWVTVRPGRRVGQRAEIVDGSPGGVTSLVSINATTRSGRRSRIGLHPRSDGGWIVTGTIGIGSGPLRLAAVASQPRAVLEAAWASALRRAGIIWLRAAPSRLTDDGPPQVLAEVSSPSLDSLASEINRRSLNFGAELLLQWAAGRERGPAQLMAHIREITGQASGVYLVDGSGLSYEDRVAPSTFIAYLARFPMTPAGRNFPQLLPANGSGTLRQLNTGLPGPGVVRAKTGTLSQASSVVGYLGRPNGVLLVSLMYNGQRPGPARQAQWELFRVLGADGVAIPADTFESAPVQLGGEEAAPKAVPLRSPAAPED